LTDANGHYEVQMTLPDLPALPQNKIDAFPVRLTAPLYTSQSQGLTKNFTEGEVVTFNFALKPAPQSAVIWGRLFDDNTGLAVVGTGVNVSGASSLSAWPISLSDGTYITLFNLPIGLPQEVELQVAGEWNNSGLRYSSDIKKVRIRPQEVKELNFPLKQDLENAAYVFGRVIDNSTGQPLPYAEVDFQCESCSYTFRRSFTDQFGNYKMDIHNPVVTGTDGTIPAIIKTTGTTNPFSTTYVHQQVSLGLFELGTSYELNFDMIKQ